ncbi:MAG: efflux RND transporter permease subunit [Haliscomenobacter sp.]|nr:efflux RND transporter permease subunit [Haliscomenobacter sp.]
MGKLPARSPDDPGDLGILYVRSNRGELIPLSNVVRTIEESNPPQLYHYNRYLSATVSAGLNDGYTLSRGLRAIRRKLFQGVGRIFHSALAGASKDFKVPADCFAFCWRWYWFTSPWPLNSKVSSIPSSS